MSETQTPGEGACCRVVSDIANELVKADDFPHYVFKFCFTNTATRN